jgi:hypothetical protein
VEDGAGLVDEPWADDVPGGEVDEIPIVDAVVTAQIEVVEFLAALLGGGLQRILLGHHTERPDPGLVNVAVDELFDLLERHVGELPGEREDRAHANTDEFVPVAVLALAGLEVALDLAQFLVVLEGEQAPGEGLGRKRHEKIFPILSMHCSRPSRLISII